jgi:hypothetical protein
VIRRVRAIAFALTALGAAEVLTAQQIRVTPMVVSMSNSEIGEELEFGGAGVGLAGSYRTGRFGVFAEGMLTSLKSGDKAVTESSYDVQMWDLRATYQLIPGLDAMVGAQARRVRPEFEAQDVGVMRIGLASEAKISRLADLGVRGALLPYSRFNGGGEAGFGFEVGLGVTVGRADARYRALMSYDFQRIDRTVNGVDVPMQMMIARLGFQMGF